MKNKNLLLFLFSVIFLNAYTQIKTRPPLFEFFKEGSIVNTYTFTSGGDGTDLIYDGLNIWANAKSGAVGISKIDLSGKVIATYTTSVGNYHSAFDGQNLWTTNYTNHSITKYQLNNFAQSTYTMTGGIVPLNLAFDGKNIWTSNSEGVGITTYCKVKNNGTYTTYYGLDSEPRGVCYANGYIYISSIDSATISKIDTSSGIIVKKYKLPIAQPYQICFDGTYLWIACNGNGTNGGICRIDELNNINSIVTPSIYSIIYDGDNIWGFSQTNYYVRISTNMQHVNNYLLPFTANMGNVVYDGTYAWGNDGDHGRMVRILLKTTVK